MRKALLLIALGLATVLTGCGWQRLDPGPAGQSSPTPSEVLSVGSSAHTVTVDGQARSFAVYRPSAPAPSAGYPLVVMLHGGLGSGAQAERAYGWDQLADQKGFVVVYPDGLGRTWNAGTCCGVAAKSGVDDVAFLTSVVEQVGAAVPLDPTRRFVTGMSNGAMMAYRMACQTDLFAAVAPVSGTQLVDCSQATPLSVLHLHGAADPTVRLDGRTGSGPGKVTGPPLATVWEGWRVRDDCGRFAISRTAEVTTAIAACPANRTVETVVVADGGHEWPGAPNSDNPGDLDATGMIWAFFAAHPHS